MKNKNRIVIYVLTMSSLALLFGSCISNHPSTFGDGIYDEEPIFQAEKNIENKKNVSRETYKNSNEDSFRNKLRQIDLEKGTNSEKISYGDQDQTNQQEPENWNNNRQNLNSPTRTDWNTAYIVNDFTFYDCYTCSSWENRNNWRYWSYGPYWTSIYINSNWGGYYDTPHYGWNRWNRWNNWYNWEYSNNWRNWNSYYLDRAPNRSRRPRRSSKYRRNSSKRYGSRSKNYTKPKASNTSRSNRSYSGNKYKRSNTNSNRSTNRSYNSSKRSSQSNRSYNKSNSNRSGRSNSSRRSSRR